MLRTRYLALASLALTLTACGGNTADSSATSDTPRRSSPAQTVSFAAAIKSQAAATDACKKLIGANGEKLQALGDEGPSAIQAGIDDGSGGPDFISCDATDGYYQHLYIVKNSQSAEDLMRSARGTITEPSEREWKVQSAFNPNAQTGVVLTGISLAKKDAAPTQLQEWANQVTN